VPDENVQALRSWALQRLRAELEARHPEVVDSFARTRIENEEDLTRLRETMTYTALQPWNDLLGALVSLELGLFDLDFALHSLIHAPDGHAVWFFDQMIPFIASSCFERTEYVIKRMIRGRLIDKAEGEALLARIVAIRTNPLFEPLRTYVAHGPFAGLGRGGWIDSGTNRRDWEIMALAGEDGAGVIAGMVNDHSRRERRVAAMLPFGEAVHGEIQRVCRRLVELSAP
jgi:hypothetical protein